MSVDFRPEYLDSDDDDWFFVSGEVPTFNIANGNAHSVLGALGLVSPESALSRDPFDTAELVGFADAKQVLGTALLYLAVEPEDSGLVSYETTGNHLGGIQSFDCGRREGYIQEKLIEIVKICEWAIAHDNRRLEWC